MMMTERSSAPSGLNQYPFGVHSLVSTGSGKALVQSVTWLICSSV